MFKKIVFGIHLKMVIFFSALFIFTATTVWYVNFYGVPLISLKGSNYFVEENAFREFSAIADLQKGRILDWVKERKNDVISLSESARLQEHLNAVFASMQPYREQGKSDAEIFQVIQSEKSFTDLIDYLALRKKALTYYDELALINSDSGIVIASTNKDNMGKRLFGDEHSLNSLDPEGFFIKALNFHASQYKHPDLVIARLVQSKNSADNNENTGNIVVLGSISMSENIMPLIREFKWLGESGEIVLVDSSGKILLPLKHLLKDGTMARPFEYKNTAEPARRAARGEEGVIDDLDYRGVPVLAAYGRLKLSPQEMWGMVVKRDKKEIFYYQKQISIYSIIVLLVSLFLGILLINIISGRIARPIRQMAELARHIEAKDFSVKADVKTNDEIGFLAESFNSMIAQIQSWREELEAKVQSRTAELDAANQQLRASEQQLKASNQQLMASQQQLRANNEHLAANEKRLQLEVETRERSESDARKHLQELQTFFKASIGREERIIELKNKVNELEEEMKKR